VLTFKEISLKEFYPDFGRGSKPGYSCTVDLQHGERSYDVVKVELPPEMVREIVAFAVSKAVECLTFDPASINVEGLAGEPPHIETPEPPEFAEVEEYSPPALAPEETQSEEML
jgi:hypothetical protein